MSKTKFVIHEMYHICNKSIANYAIFGNTDDANRFKYILDYYNNLENKTSFSEMVKKKRYTYTNLLYPRTNGVVTFLSYCIMPDHYHLLLKVIKETLIIKYINDFENSYSRYFNLKYNRKGPLWQSSYRSVHIISNEQLLHTSRYIHLNPKTNYLVEKPEQWLFSSYCDLISNQKILNNFKEFSIKNKYLYKKFVENNIDYQRKLKKMRRLFLE